eukprot:GFYU01014792.1.p1 GENE.GFYU01014792.1~~GFYU01014792.1.p1  ORF type:complete len:245 (+),score=65.06 GFYU01014792.1:61-795(+)
MSNENTENQETVFQTRNNGKGRPPSKYAQYFVNLRTDAAGREICNCKYCFEQKIAQVKTMVIHLRSCKSADQAIKLEANEYYVHKLRAAPRAKKGSATAAPAAQESVRASSALDSEQLSKVVLGQLRSAIEFASLTPQQWQRLQPTIISIMYISANTPGFVIPDLSRLGRSADESFQVDWKRGPGAAGGASNPPEDYVEESADEEGFEDSPVRRTPNKRKSPPRDAEDRPRRGGKRPAAPPARP